MRTLFVFPHILGVFIFNEHYNIVDKILFTKKEDYQNKDKIIQQLLKKYPNAQKPDAKKTHKILEVLKEKKYFEQFCTINIELTKDKLRTSVSNDQLILQTISNIEEIDKVCNILTKRLREWYAYYNPEAENTINDNKKFTELIVEQKLKKEKNSIGAELSKENLNPIIELSKKIKNLFELKEIEEKYLENIMKQHCPNIAALTGVSIGAKLLEKAGSLKKLSEFPASTIQLLGAEKALFRHLKNKKHLSPKFGYLHEHVYVMKAKNRDKGKVARMLADKIAIAAKVDYFKGKFVADELKKQLEKKL